MTFFALTGRSAIIAGADTGIGAVASWAESCRTMAA